MSFRRPPASFSIAPGVVGFRSVLVNYYFVTSSAKQQAPAEWFLVDTGLKGEARHLLAAATRRFDGRPPAAIILTHGHFDHVGALPEMLQHWHVPVYAHLRELPFLNQRVPYPPPDPDAGGGLLAQMSRFFPRRVGPFRVMVHPLPLDGRVPKLDGWTWIHTPGHTPGHVSLWREADRVLLAGDALVSTRQESAIAVWSQTPEIRPPPAYFTVNWRLAYESIERLRALQPQILASGHGWPISGAALRGGIDQLAREFETRGLPRDGYYARATWAPT